MVRTFTIPWSAWYGKEEYVLEFPDTWNVQLFSMRDSKEITNLEELETALKNPIGTPTIQEIAQGKKNAVIVVEDISRPTRTGHICELVLKELNEAGISNDNITLIAALGAHRPMTREDFIKKVGEKVVESINIENHHPYENLVFLGNSTMGTPIYLNKTYHDADVKIAVGTVIPHALAGFGGGAKIILPGICGIQTLEANHQAAVKGIGVGLGFVTELRKDIEEVCGRVGLDFSINVVSTMKRGIAGIFAGHYIEAHREAVELAKKVYGTELPKLTGDDRLDLGFFNLYPEDTELSQAIKGFPLFFSAQELFKQEAAIIFLTASTEGRGYHSLIGETGGRLYQNWGEHLLFKVLSDNPFGIFSPNLSKADIFHYYPRRTIFHKDFQKMVQELEEVCGPSPRAGIFPTSIQLTSNE